MNTAPGKQGIVILGATSPVARKIAVLFAEKGHPVVLGARNHEECVKNAADVTVRTELPCHALYFEAEDITGHQKFWENCTEVLGAPPLGIVVCFGYMADQRAAQDDFSLVVKMLHVNLLGVMSILEIAGKDLVERGEGFIAVISSVAGDRGRQSNYFYGSAKAGLSVYLQGLRNRMYPAGITVTTLKPGFMDTPMTQGMDLPKHLVTSPEVAAVKIVRAIDKKKNTAYIPAYWRFIMFMICSIPEALFKRLKL